LADEKRPNNDFVCFCKLLGESPSPNYAFGRPQKVGAWSGDRKILAGWTSRLFRSIEIGVAVCGWCMIFCMSDLLYKIIKPTGTIKHEIKVLACALKFLN